MNPDFLQQQLHWRYATKYFDTDRPVANETAKQILEAMRMAPSAYGVQPWKFVVVTDPELRAELRPLSYDQAQVTEASHLIVVAARNRVEDTDVDRYMRDMAETRGITVDQLEGFAKMIKGDVVAREPAESGHWAAQQTYITLGFGLLAAALLEVDSCPMEGFDHAAVSEKLGLADEGYTALAYLALGYRSEKDETVDLEKVRYAMDEVVEWR